MSANIPIDPRPLPAPIPNSGFYWIKIATKGYPYTPWEIFEWTIGVVDAENQRVSLIDYIGCEGEGSFEWCYYGKEDYQYGLSVVVEVGPEIIPPK